MNIELFNIGAIAQNKDFYTLVLSLLAGILAIALIFWMWKLEKKIKKLLGGNKAMSIESAIAESHREIKELRNFQKETLEHLRNMEVRIKRSIQTTETVRFNPFKGTGTGGNQSFSSAFLDEKGDGLVLSGLFLRERFSVYAKPLKNYQGEFELTNEEKETVKRAKAKVEGN